jgi:crotonobetaine/carnitine-CoA ligase
MTEASSFTTVDDLQTIGSVGQALPWMEVELVETAGQPVAEGAVGEFAVRPRHDGLLTPGYLGNADATARLVKDGWLYTGDMGRRDASGSYYFLGRKTESLRRRGENISAWEVETGLSAHPDIAETAIVGVPSEIGEAEILCFLIMREGTEFDPVSIVGWCQNHLPRHHVPRYWKQVDGFERTPSQRIRKDCLDTSLADAIDTGDRAATVTSR